MPILSFISILLVFYVVNASSLPSPNLDDNPTILAVNIINGVLHASIIDPTTSRVIIKLIDNYGNIVESIENSGKFNTTNVREYIP